MIDTPTKQTTDPRLPADDEASVARDAKLSCRVCGGKGWHDGWNQFHEPVMLRCPCVDQNRKRAAS